MEAVIKEEEFLCEQEELQACMDETCDKDKGKNSMRAFTRYNYIHSSYFDLIT